MWTSLSEDIWSVESKQMRKNKQGCHVILAGPQLPWLLATCVKAWGIPLIPCVIVAFVIWNKNSPHGKATEDQLEKMFWWAFYFIFGGVFFLLFWREVGVLCVWFYFSFCCGMYVLYFSGEEYIVSGFVCSLVLRRWEAPQDCVNCYFKQ